MQLQMIGSTDVYLKVVQYLALGSKDVRNLYFCKYCQVFWLLCHLFEESYSNIPNTRNNTATFSPDFKWSITCTNRRSVSFAYKVRPTCMSYF